MTEDDVKHSIKRLREISSMDNPTKAAQQELVAHAFDLLAETILNLKILTEQKNR